MKPQLHQGHVWTAGSVGTCWTAVTHDLRNLVTQSILSLTVCTIDTIPTKSVLRIKYLTISSGESPVVAPEKIQCRICILSGFLGVKTWQERPCNTYNLNCLGSTNFIRVCLILLAWNHRRKPTSKLKAQCGWIKCQDGLPNNQILIQNCSMRLKEVIF